MPATFIDQNRIKQRSRIVTVLFLIMIFLLSYFWVLVRDSIPPKDEIHYEVAGRMDFGNYTEGSSNVNTREAPSAQRQQTSTSNPTPQPSSPVQEKVITSEEPSEIEASNQEPQPASKPTPQKKVNKDALFEKGGESGSNHGDGTDVGNRGRPDSPYLDPNGMYAFGTGGDGLNGRKVLNGEFPKKHHCQEEGKITFAITVAPNGSVINVKAVKFAGQRCLRGFTEDYIRKNWRFSKANFQSNQVMKVTFNFKLK